MRGGRGQAERGVTQISNFVSHAHRIQEASLTTLCQLPKAKATCGSSRPFCLIGYKLSDSTTI
eukprot:scaffold243576_cov33-Tisochrysis_lutea.AAC.3